jgi:hypothetical protein
MRVCPFRRRPSRTSSFQFVRHFPNRIIYSLIISSSMYVRSSHCKNICVLYITKFHLTYSVILVSYVLVLGHLIRTVIIKIRKKVEKLCFQLAIASSYILTHILMGYFVNFSVPYNIGLYCRIIG